MKKYSSPGLPGLFRLMMVLTGIFLFTLLFIRCAGQDKSAGEKLLGFSLNYDKNEVSVTVITKGCTGKADISFKVQGNTITVLRQKKDECKAMPEAVVFTYSLKAAGLDASKSYTVSNLFIANPNLADVR